MQDQDGDFGGGLVGHPGNTVAKHELQQARQAWSAGNWTRTRGCAQRALAGAAAAHDRHLDASASLLLAQVLTLESRFDWAQRFASRASGLFRALSTQSDSIEALLILSYIHSARGHEDLAVRATAEAGRFSGDVEHLGGAALNYSGVAAFWRRDHGTARAVLDAACQLAPQYGAASFQPLVNAAFSELLRCADMRMRGHRTDVSDLLGLVARARQVEQWGATESLSSAAASTAGLFLLEFESFYAANLTGNTARADGFYLACLKRAVTLPSGSWMQGLVLWAQLERARAASDLRGARRCANAMVRTYTAGEHAPMRELALRLRSHLGQLSVPPARHDA